MTAMATPKPRTTPKRQGNPLLQVRIPDAELDFMRERARALGYPSLSACARFLLRENLMRSHDDDAPRPPRSRRARRSG